MTDEELNRKFDIVAEHLATLAVNQQKADERMEKSDARIDRLERVLSLAIRSYRRERKETREKFDALIAAQIHTDESLAKLAQAQSNLAESLEHTDKRLDTLIDIVRDNRNGNSNV
jgi:hypothetical protein